MTQYKIKSHAVEASCIISLQPLMGRNTELMSPESGLMLVLDDNSKHQWVSEKIGMMPCAGDFLVKDTELNIIYVVAATKFQNLFRGPKSW
jgi:hypothetical protein